MVKQDITGNGGTSYTLSHPVSNENDILLYINNVKQEGGSGKAFTASGTTLTLSEAIANTDTCYVQYIGLAIQTVVPPDGSVSTAKIADDAVTNVKVATGISSSKLTGALPAIDGSALTGVSSIGVGQTWTDVTSSRAKDTEYQNTTGKPIMISVTFTTAFTAIGQISVSSSSGTGFVVIARADGGDYYSSTAYTLHETNISLIIPNNIYYKITGNNATLTVQAWAELR